MWGEQSDLLRARHIPAEALGSGAIPLASKGSVACGVSVRLADFNGDGRADLAGCALQTGQWFVGLSAGTALVTRQWDARNPGVALADVCAGHFA
jgi:hypothetical protein